MEAVKVGVGPARKARRGRKTREEIYGCGEVSRRELGERTGGAGVIGKRPKEKEEDKEHLSVSIYTNRKKIKLKI